MPLLPGNSTHPTDTIRQGMDVPYRVVFYLSTLTFMGVTLWAYQLQIRAARLLERQEAAAEVPAGPRTEAVRVDRPALGDTP